MKRSLSLLLALAVVCALLAGCGGNSAPAPASTQAPAATDVPAADTPAAPAPTEAPEEVPVEEVDEAGLADGVYQVDVKTDSSMFHINEAHKGKGVLTVENGQMTVHITLASKKITLLYAGLAEDAKVSETHIEPSLDSVTYDDGMTEEAYGFDVPVPALDEDIACAILGSKGNWYDHVITVSNPVPMDEVG